MDREQHHGKPPGPIPALEQTERSGKHGGPQQEQRDARNPAQSAKELLARFIEVP
jgi:hypothetical protein